MGVFNDTLKEYGLGSGEKFKVQEGKHAIRILSEPRMVQGAGHWVDVWSAVSVSWRADVRGSCAFGCVEDQLTPFFAKEDTMRLTTALGLALLFFACGGKNAGTPVGPTPTAPAPPSPAPTVTALSIIGSRALRTGQRETMRAEATLSNGATQAAANSTWSSSNTSVATVSEAGAVAALAQGSANISVSAGGASAQLPIQVWQDYQGTWAGSYVITVCTETGTFWRGFCRLFPRGTELPFQLVLTQTNDTANGTLDLGSFSGSMRGGIFDNRRFVGAGTLSTSLDGLLLNATVGTFSVLSTSNSLTGNLVITNTVDGISGNSYWEAMLGPVTRSLRPISLDTREFDAKVRSILKQP